MSRARDRLRAGQSGRRDAEVGEKNQIKGVEVQPQAARAGAVLGCRCQGRAHLKWRRSATVGRLSPAARKSADEAVRKGEATACGSSP